MINETYISINTSPIGIFLNTTAPDVPASIPIYHATVRQGDIIYKALGDVMTPKENVTSEQDAPIIGAQAMKKYGGLPPDAVFAWSETNYAEIQTGTGLVISKKPVSTSVAFGRKVNGLSLEGDTDGIRLELGSNGELLELRKLWRTLTFSGNVTIIPATKAVEKLERGEIIEDDWRSPNVTALIDIIRLRYYQKSDENTDLEPVWVFIGETEPGDYGIKFIVYARQFANFSATPTIGSYPLTVRFTDSSEASPIRWHWNFGDGTNSTLQNPTHTYQSGGNYTVNLTAWNDLGSDTISKTEIVTVYSNPAPVSGFVSNYSWENSKVPVVVAFTDTSTGVISNWSWDFGDGTNSTERNPAHIFNATPGKLYGDYWVNLSVTDDVGRVSSYSDYIGVVKGLVPNFTAEPTRGPAPLIVRFTDFTQDYEKALGSYWEFGDGEYYWPEENPAPRVISHEYLTEGIYNVTLWYNGAREEPYWQTKDYYVIVGDITPPPVADFSANITSGKVPLAVTFSDASMGSPTDWNWDFGDTAVSLDQNPVHVYSEPGIFTVELSASNAVGTNTVTRIGYITVNPITVPLSGFAADPVSGKIPLTVSFTDASGGTPTGWSWDFGDGTSSPLQNPVHSYLTTGTFTVSLNASNADGSNIKIMPDLIAVYPRVPPAANFTANPLSGTVPLLVAFKDQSYNNPTGWYWDFGDGYRATDQNPIHGFDVAGKYTVSLKTSNNDGSDTIVKKDYISVTAPVIPVADFTANSTRGKLPLTVAFTDTSTNVPNRWLWNFGDGGVSTEQNPVYSYVTTGTFTVSIRALNADGGNQMIKEDYITVLPNFPPVASFTTNVTTGSAPLAVSFTDTSTSAPDSRVWEFGDGTTSTVQNPAHIYPVPGKYTVSLTATNPDGSGTITKPDYITVTSPIQTPTPTPTPSKITSIVRIEPETLNLKSKGVFTAFITLPTGYDVNNIDAVSLVCEGAHMKSGHATGGGSKEYIAKFERQDLVGIVPGDAVAFTVTGNIVSGGRVTGFQGSDTIRVIDNP